MADKKLPDVPWHLGYVTKEEEDPRRHKSRCIFNHGYKCRNPNMTACYSSSHCKYYAEDLRQAEKFKLLNTPRLEAGSIVKVQSGIFVYEDNKKHSDVHISGPDSNYDKPQILVVKKKLIKRNKHKKKALKSICPKCNRCVQGICSITNKKMVMESCNQFE